MKYDVNAYVEGKIIYEVEADSEEEAIEKVRYGAGTVKLDKTSFTDFEVYPC